MNFIAFAHLTVTRAHEEVEDLQNDEYFRLFLSIPNPVEKKKIMSTDSKTHDIKIIRNNFDFEINKYIESSVSEGEVISDSLLRDFDSKSEIKSSSFTPEFFCNLENILRLKSLSTDSSIKLRTLNPLKFITLKYDKNFPQFNQKVDIPGIASIAFYVGDIDSTQPLKDSSRETKTFVLRLGIVTYKIRFVRCGEVWVEFIERI